MVLIATCSSSGCPIYSFQGAFCARQTRPLRLYGARRPSSKSAFLPLALTRVCAYGTAWMRGAEAQLEPGERVLFETRQHPMAFSGAAGMALCVTLVVFLLIRHNDLPTATELQIALAGLPVAVAALLPAL